MHRGGDHPTLLNLKDINIISTLGRGAKGVVFLIQMKQNDKLLALKAVLRCSGSVESRRIGIEEQVLASFCHPLLPKLHGVLFTEKIVGYAIDYCPGRDLNLQRKKQTEKMFSDDTIRFYGAELVLGLEYLHGLGIVYRDLKPENVMIQENGHLMLVDFDLSTRLAGKISSVEISPVKRPVKISSVNHGCTPFFKRRESGISPGFSVESTESDSVEKSNSFVGTEDYVAPEIIQGKGHDFAVDWWCLGVVLYEMLYGKTPFQGSNRKETFHRIMTKSPDLTGEVTPLRDLIGKLLEKDPKKRISVTAIKAHDYFRTVEWDSIMEILRPPFIPEPPQIGEYIKNIDLDSFVQQALTENSHQRNNACDNFCEF